MSTFAEDLKTHSKYCKVTIDQIKRLKLEGDLTKSSELLDSLDLVIQNFDLEHKDKLEFLEFFLKNWGSVD